jgi:prefoldin subunit 5
MTIPEAIADLKQGVTHAVEAFSQTIDKLNSTIIEIDRVNELRYRVLREDLKQISDRLEETASQKSLTETSATLRRQIQGLGANLNTIMEYLRPKAL